MSEPTRVRTSTTDTLGSTGQDIVRETSVNDFVERVEHHADATQLREIERVAVGSVEQTTTTTVNASGGEVLIAERTKSGRVVFSKTVLAAGAVAVILAGLALLFEKKEPPRVETAPLAYSSPRSTSVRYRERSREPGAEERPVRKTSEIVLAPVISVEPAVEPVVSAEPVVPLEAPVRKGCVSDPNGAPGFITVSSRPYSDAYLGGKKIGETPLSRYKLAPGCHELRFVARDGRERRERLIVESNRVSIFTVRF
jgi:hypothetical protein